MFQCRFQPSADTPHSRPWPALYCVGSKDGMLTTVPHRLPEEAHNAPVSGPPVLGGSAPLGSYGPRPLAPSRVPTVPVGARAARLETALRRTNPTWAPNYSII